jgi:hypothetical protein
MQEFDLLEKFSPTCKDFIVSTKTITVIIASLGEGKTFACIGALIGHAGRCGQPIRCAIVRDTLENIKLSIVPSIQEFFSEFFPDNPHKMYRFKNEFKELTIFTNPRIDADLFGIDDPAAMGKLQGSSAYSLIWLNEPAPIADKANAGLSEETYNVAVIRAVRRKGTPGRLIVDMNPADEEHWTHRRFIEEEDYDPNFPLVQKQVWFVPYGENAHLKEESRQAAKKMYANDEAAYARYVTGEFAQIYRGEKVTPQYKRERHLCPDILVPAPGLVSFAFFDSWHNPAAVLGQVTSTGRLTFIDTLRLLNSDIRTLIDTLVMPLLNSPKWKGKPNSWRIGGDFTMKQPDQSNRNESAARVVESAFRKFLRLPSIFFEAGPSKWETMKRHIAWALQGSDFRGDSLVLLSANNRLLDKGLRGAWHYKTDNSGNVLKHTKPEKDVFSHPCDGWANAVGVLLPSMDLRVNLYKYRQAAAKSKQRVQSYVTTGAGL